MRTYNYYLVAGISIVLGIFLSIFFNEGHYYTFFTIGVTMLLFQLYNHVSNKKLFYRWRFRNFLVFFILLIFSSIIIDRIGIYLGYWIYPQFTNFFDEILKYIFEWAIALSYHGILLAVGTIFFMKRGVNKPFAFLLSLVIFITLAGLATEYINSFSLSWKVIAMPLTNYKVGGFFIVFQTIGYWLMAIIPLTLYKISDKLQRRKK